MFINGLCFFSPLAKASWLLLKKSYFPFIEKGILPKSTYMFQPAVDRAEQQPLNFSLPYSRGLLAYLTHPAGRGAVALEGTYGSNWLAPSASLTETSAPDAADIAFCATAFTLAKFFEAPAADHHYGANIGRVIFYPAYSAAHSLVDTSFDALRRAGMRFSLAGMHAAPLHATSARASFLRASRKEIFCKPPGFHGRAALVKFLLKSGSASKRAVGRN